VTDFEVAHEVTIARPVDDVFPVLALADDLERVLRLSSLVTDVAIVSDEVGRTPSTEVITFEFGERVPVLPLGLYSARVTMRVEQTVDLEQRRVDYWSHTKHGAALSVHKVRTFEPVDNGTRVAEVVHGHAPPGLHLIARRAARKAHREHMEGYPSLFEPVTR
jgi:uncharacterized protein YndB with AHSA1/START domain